MVGSRGSRVLGMVLVFVFMVVGSKAFAGEISDADGEDIQKALMGWAAKVGRPNVDRILKADGRERRQLIELLNKQLEAKGQPKIASPSEIQIRKSCIIGFVPETNCFYGVEIEDRENRFCLPCIVPHNVVHWLVQDKKLPLPRPPGEGVIYDSDSEPSSTTKD